MAVRSDFQNLKTKIITLAFSDGLPIKIVLYQIRVSSSLFQDLSLIMGNENVLIGKIGFSFYYFLVKEDQRISRRDKRFIPSTKDVAMIEVFDHQLLQKPRSER